MGFLTPSANGASVKINKEGEVFQGTVSGPVELRQSIDFQSKQPAFYKNGNPKVEAVVPMTGTDGLPYRLFVPEFGNLKDSMVKAALEQKTDDFYIGSQWTIKNTGKQATNSGMMAHTYEVTCHNAGNGEGGTPDASQVKLASAPAAPAAAAAPAGQPFGAPAGYPAPGGYPQAGAPAMQPQGMSQGMSQGMPQGMAQGMPQQGFNNGGFAQAAPQQGFGQPAGAAVNPWQEPPY